jgi:hypothetical protein
VVFWVFVGGKLHAFSEPDHVTADKDQWREAYEEERAAHQATREALAVTNERAGAAVGSARVAATASDRPGTWNIGTGFEANVLDLVEVIGKVGNRAVTPEFAAPLPGELLRSAIALGQPKPTWGGCRLPCWWTASAMCTAGSGTARRLGLPPEPPPRQSGPVLLHLIRTPVGWTRRTGLTFRYSRSSA